MTARRGVARPHPGARGSLSAIRRRTGALSARAFSGHGSGVDSMLVLRIPRLRNLGQADAITAALAPVPGVRTLEFDLERQQVSLAGELEESAVRAALSAAELPAT